MAKILVLQGGRSAEREISLKTGAQVSEALRAVGHETLSVDSADPDFISQIQSYGPDAAFICLHGRFGEDGTVQGMLELIEVPYVGSGVLASALAMDKTMSKHIYAHFGIPTPAYEVLYRGDDFDAEQLTAALGEKTVVKPASEGSSFGMTIAHSAGELPAAIELAFEYGATVLVEAFVAGAEVTVGVIGNDELLALPTLEVIPEHEFYDYESKYVPGMSTHIVPANISEEAREECRDVALRAHRALGCRGMSRTDTIVTSSGEVLVLETNTIPGMTETSLLPDAARAAGIEFPELCDTLVRLALEDQA